MEPASVVTDRAKQPGLLLQSVAFVIVAIPTFYIAMVVAALPCFDNVPGSYCSAHGGGVIFTGVALGLILAVVSGIACVRALKKSFANDASSRT